jgi:hypothetical protein
LLRSALGHLVRKIRSELAPITRSDPQHSPEQNHRKPKEELHGRLPAPGASIVGDNTLEAASAIRLDVGSSAELTFINGRKFLLKIR